MEQLVTIEAATLAVFKADLSKLREAMRANIGTQKLTERDLTQIKVPGGSSTQFTNDTPEGEKQTPTIDGLIIGWHDRRQYYTTPFGSGDGKKPPDCTSADGLIGIGDPGGSCAECPLAKYGSGNDNAQACRHYRSLLIIRGDRLLPEVISVPPTSLVAHRQFQVNLSSFGLPCHSVLTSISLLRTKNAKGTPYAEMAFKMIRELTPEEFAKAEEYAKVFGLHAASAVMNI